MKESQKNYSVTVVFGNNYPEDCLKSILQNKYYSIISDFTSDRNTAPQEQERGEEI